MNARLSAIITAYNSAAFVAGAVESVLNQTRPPDEVIVIDDGSQDDTVEIARSFASRGVRVITQANQGAGAARNRGLRETSGELVSFLDADDEWLPDKAERQLASLAAHPEVEWVSGDKIWWDVDRNTRKRHRPDRPQPADYQREIVVRNFVGNPSMTLIRRAALGRSGPFDPSLRWGQDWELWIRLLCLARAGLWFESEPVILYRWHSKNVSHQTRFERLDCFETIARRAIAAYAPGPLQSRLMARGLASLELDRARQARRQGWSRSRQWSHLSRALWLDPLAQTADKLKLLARIMLGDVVYQRLRREA